MVWRSGILVTLLLAGCANSARTYEPETQIKYFKISADPEIPDAPRTLLSTGDVVLFVDDNQCLKVRSIISEQSVITPANANQGFIPIFFPETIIGSDEAGFFIRHPAAVEDYRQRDDIVGTDPIRLGDVTAFGISEPMGEIIEHNGANPDICQGSRRGVYLSPPLSVTKDENGRIMSMTPIFELPDD